MQTIFSYARSRKSENFQYLVLLGSMILQSEFTPWATRVGPPEAALRLDIRPGATTD